jgi:serine/threonine protein kinase
MSVTQSKKQYLGQIPRDLPLKSREFCDKYRLNDTQCIQTLVRLLTQIFSDPVDVPSIFNDVSQNESCHMLGRGAFGRVFSCNVKATVTDNEVWTPDSLPGMQTKLTVQQLCDQFGLTTTASCLSSFWDLVKTAYANKSSVDNNHYSFRVIVKILAPVVDSRMDWLEGSYPVAEQEASELIARCRDLKLEYMTLARLNHPNIIKTYGFFSASQTLIKQLENYNRLSSEERTRTIRERIYGVMEQIYKTTKLLLEPCDMTLKQYMQNEESTLQEKLLLMINFYEGLLYLKNKNYYHADLKPDNIFLKLDPDLILKIGDMGSAGETKSLIGRAPKNIIGNQFWYLWYQYGSIITENDLDSIENMMFFALCVIALEFVSGVPTTGSDEKPIAYVNRLSTLFEDIQDLRTELVTEFSNIVVQRENNKNYIDWDIIGHIGKVLHETYRRTE